MPQEYPYSAADIDLTQINWDRFCRFDALHAANGDAMLRVLLSGKPVIALRFDACSVSRLQGIRHKWGQAYYSVYGLEDRRGMKSSVKERNDWSDIVPVSYVDTLPHLEMWDGSTRWGEDAFWASPELRILVSQEGGGCCVKLLELTGIQVGKYRFACLNSRDSVVEALALFLKEKLRIASLVRFEESRRGKLCAWYR